MKTIYFQTGKASKKQKFLKIKKINWNEFTKEKNIKIIKVAKNLIKKHKIIKKDI